MRTQLIESLLFGLLISVFVLLARWLFPGQLLLEVVAVLAGAAVLTVLQLVVQRQTHTQTSNEPTQPTAESAPAAPEPTTPLHSPRLEWADNNSQEQSAPIPEAPSSAAEQTSVPAEEGDKTSKKMV
jgi:hypothetical protein